MSKMMSEQITYLLANYNNGQYIRACVNSLHAQTDPRWQCLIADDGSTSEHSILRYMADVADRVHTPLAQRTDRTGNGDVRVTGIRCLDTQTRIPLTTVRSGQALYLEVSYAAAPTYQKPINSLMINLDFRTQLDHYIFSFNSRMANHAFEQPLPATGQLYCYSERFPLMPGRFFVNATLHLNGSITDRILYAFTLDVEEGDFLGTGVAYHWNQQSVYVPHRWLGELP